MMSAVPDLVGKVMQMHSVGTNSLGLLQQNEVIAPLLNTSKDTAFNLDFQVIMERITKILQEMGDMKISPLMETVQPAPGFNLPPITYTPSPAPVTPEKYTVQGTWPDLDDMIRRMVRRILGQRGSEPQEPPKVEIPSIPGMDKISLPGEEDLKINEDLKLFPRRAPTPLSLSEYQNMISKSLMPIIPNLKAMPLPPSPDNIESQLKEDFKELLQDRIPIIPELTPPKPSTVSRVNQMGYDIGRTVSTIQQGQPTSPTALSNLQGVNTQIMEVVSQKIVGVSLSAASLDVKPAVMENVASMSKQLYSVTSPGKPGAPVSPINFKLNLVPRSPRTPEEISELISPELEREAESKSAHIAAEVKRVSEQVAKKGVQIYKSGMENLAPYKTLSGDSALGITPDIAALASKEMLEASQTMYELQEASKDIQNEKGTNPMASAFFLSMLANLAMKGPSALGGHETLNKTIEGQGSILDKLLKAPMEKLFRGGSIANVGEAISKSLPPSTMGDIGKILDTPAAKSNVMENFTKQMVKTSTGVQGAMPAPVSPELLQKAALAPPSQIGASVGLKATKPEEGAVSQMIQQKVESEKAASKSLDKLLSEAVKEPQNKEVVKSTPPSGPGGVASPKLHQVMPILQQAAASSMLASRSASVKSEYDSVSRRPVEVKVEYDIDDIDMKELERKIAKILKEEARRYGVY